jgi:glycosyltransferase involved in cell wall biosynthesis
LRDGENGFLVTRNKLSIASALERITALSEDERQAMGDNARRCAASFSEERFADAWRDLYGNLNGSLALQQHLKDSLLERTRPA